MLSLIPPGAEEEFQALLNQVGKCPDPNVGAWASEVTKLFGEEYGVGPAIHFVRMLISDYPTLDNCLAYMNHIIEQGRAEVGEEVE